MNSPIRKHENQSESCDYRAAVASLVLDVNDEKLIRRVWRLLILAYNEQ